MVGIGRQNDVEEPFRAGQFGLLHGLGLVAVFAVFRAGPNFSPRTVDSLNRNDASSTSASGSFGRARTASSARGARPGRFHHHGAGNRSSPG